MHVVNIKNLLGRGQISSANVQHFLNVVISDFSVRLSQKKLIQKCATLALTQHRLTRRAHNIIMIVRRHSGQPVNTE